MSEPPAARHRSHADVVKRLKRADGHLRKVVRMIEDAQPCADVAQQLQAIESALRSAKQVYIRDHIDHCMDDHVRAGDAGAAVLAEFKQITKYL